MELTPGLVLAGRYRLTQKLGQGGMGAVWAAKNLTVGTDVAVKTLTLDASANSEIVMRFRREAHLLACVHSDHVCRVLDFASDEKYGQLLVLDFIRGRSLAEVVGERYLSVEEALDIGTDVARGMLDLHRANIVHRDLKPGNILLEPRPNNTVRALIVDFGLGRRMQSEQNQESGITSMDTALGTLEYMAPDQILNSRGAGQPADIYSLGAILYRAVMGRHAFGDLKGAALAQTKLSQDPPPLQTGRQDPIAAGLEAIVNRALRKRPQDRYATTDELLADLLALHRRREEFTRPPPPSQISPTAVSVPSPLAATIPVTESPVVAPAPLPVPVRGGVSGGVVFLVVLLALGIGAAGGVFGERYRVTHGFGRFGLRTAPPPSESGH